MQKRSRPPLRVKEDPYAQEELSTELKQEELSTEEQLAALALPVEIAQPVAPVDDNVVDDEH